MKTLATATELMALIARHELLPPDRSALARASVKNMSGRDFLCSLVKTGWLTAFQANLLLRRRSDELVLGPYLLLSRIGKGGMGQVFKARHRTLNRIVALKLLREEKISSKEAVLRFRREIQLSSQLAHPNIVYAYDAGEINGVHYYTMEYVEGIDLSQHVRRSGRLPIVEAVQYLYQAALALQHAHERGLVHRDIKPSNFLLTKQDGEDVVKLLDLGLARIAEGSEDTALTHDGRIVGTPDYIAPEQARSAHTADIRADLYSLGCTFHFLLTGQVPFPGGKSIVEKLVKHQMEDPTPIETLRPDVPLPLRAVLKRLVARDPERRFQTPEQLAKTLELWLAGARGTAFHASSTTEVQKPPAAAALPDWLGDVEKSEQPARPPPAAVPDWLEDVRRREKQP